MATEFLRWFLGVPRVGVILLGLLGFFKPSMPSGRTTTGESRHIGPVGSERRKLVEVLPLFRDKRTAVTVTEQVQQAVTRYIVSTFMINIGQEVAVGLALWGLGMHSPWLWGGLTILLEFIPYLSATGILILLSAAAFSQFDSLGHILHGQTVAAFAVVLVPWHCECGTQRLNNTEEKQQDNHHQRDS